MMTQRGQVTVPAYIRRILGVKPREQVAFEVKSNEVRLVPVTSTLESTCGSVTPKNHPEDFEALVRQAKEERATRTINKLNQT
jgi:AbrB family looped-hinge helix DNA binding protein